MIFSDAMQQFIDDSFVTVLLSNTLIRLFKGVLSLPFLPLIVLNDGVAFLWYLYKPRRPTSDTCSVATSQISDKAVRDDPLSLSLPTERGERGNGVSGEGDTSVEIIQCSTRRDGLGDALSGPASLTSHSTKQYSISVQGQMIDSQKDPQDIQLSRKKPRHTGISALSFNKAGVIERGGAAANPGGCSS